MKFRIIIDTADDQLVERITNDLTVDEVDVRSGVMELRMIDRPTTAERYEAQRNGRHPATVTPLRPAVAVVEPDPQPEPGSEPEPPGTSPDNLSCADAIVATLNAEADTAFGPAQVAAELPRFKQSTVAFTLAQLVKAGRIERRGRGLYGAIG